MKQNPSRKIAPAIPKNRTCHFAKSHLRFLKIACAIFDPCRRGIGYWIFPRGPAIVLPGGMVTIGRQANFQSLTLQRSTDAKEASVLMLM